jgi:hypothetical protein
LDNIEILNKNNINKNNNNNNNNVNNVNNNNLNNSNNNNNNINFNNKSYDIKLNFSNDNNNNNNINNNTKINSNNNNNINNNSNNNNNNNNNINNKNNNNSNSKNLYNLSINNKKDIEFNFLEKEVKEEINDNDMINKINFDNFNFTSPSKNLNKYDFELELNNFNNSLNNKISSPNKLNFYGSYKDKEKEVNEETKNNNNNNNKKSVYNMWQNNFNDMLNNSSSLPSSPLDLKTSLLKDFSSTTNKNNESNLTNNSIFIKKFREKSHSDPPKLKLFEEESINEHTNSKNSISRSLFKDIKSNEEKEIIIENNNNNKNDNYNNKLKSIEKNKCTLCKKESTFECNFCANLRKKGIEISPVYFCSDCTLIGWKNHQKQHEILKEKYSIFL